MAQLVEFSVGQQYENRKGIYEVLELQGDVMHIRWENGEEIDTTVTMQSRIINGMQSESEQLTNGKAASPSRKRAVSNGWQRIRL